MIFGTKRIEQLEEKVKQLGLDNDILKNRLDAQAKLVRSLQELVYGQIKENLSLSIAATTPIQPSASQCALKEYLVGSCAAAFLPS